VVDFLISILSSDNSDIRNRAALALENIKDNRALEPLLAAIFIKENHNYNGTMVFALEPLDCSKKLKEIFKILFFETYESNISFYQERLTRNTKNVERLSTVSRKMSRV